MTVTSIDKDPEALTLTVHAAFDVPVERVWQLWADPRQLERWWGPPTYPATVTTHDLVVGGRVEYHMTGPEGDQHGGYWEVLEVAAPHHLLVRDGFADESGRPNDELPSTTMEITIAAGDGGGATMDVVSRFPSSEAMARLLEMGLEEGIAAAMGQIEGILAGDA